MYFSVPYCDSCLCVMYKLALVSYLTLLHGNGKNGILQDHAGYHKSCFSSAVMEPVEEK